MSRSSTPGNKRASGRVRRHSEVSNESEIKTPNHDDDHDDQEEDELQDRKRRRSNINYSLARKYNHGSSNSTPNGKSSKKSDKHLHNGLNSNQIIKSTKDSNFIEDSRSLKSHQKNIQNLSGIDQLAYLSSKHSLLTEELFHLKRFTSLATWDPDSQPSKYYHDFVEEDYDLWNNNNKDQKSIPNGRKSRHSSRVQQIDPLKQKIDELSIQYDPELFNPSQFYEDNFLIEQTKEHKPQRKGKSIIIHPIESPAKSKIKQENESLSSPSQPPSSTGRGRGRGRKPRSPSPQPSPQPKKRGRKPGSKNIKKEPIEQEQDEEEDQNSEDVEIKQDSSDEDSEFDIETPPPFFPNDSIPKVKFKFSLPKPLITNPDHIPKPQFNSLDEFLKSYKSLDEDITIEEYNEHISEQQSLITKIQKAVDNNVLTIDNEFNFHKVPPPFPFRNPLLNQHTHNDHLVGQAVHMSKLFENSRKSRIQRARKIANMIEVHFKRAAGAAERAKKEEERRIKTLARNAVQVVKKRWMLAERAYKILKNQEAEELRRIKGKEHLSQMLEHSTQLLEAQMTKQDDADNDVEMLSDEDDDAKNEVNIPDDEEDANLTVEELRAKYAHLQDLKESEEEEEEQEEGEEEEETEIVQPELTEKELEAIKQANEESDSMLDSDDSLDSDDESSSEEESDEEVSEDDGKPSGLASLFGSVPQQEESDDESATYSDNNEKIEEDEESNADDEKDEEETKENSTPSSTPDVIDKTEVEESTKKSRSTSVEPNDGVVDVPNPDLLLRGNLRTYQKQGLNWMASLYNNHTNGILADEMGLGKTIQTISLLCYLAVYKEIWGPHLIVVPTSVLLNWEMEFKRFAPGFKVLVYYGSPQQRKDKRKGWNKPDTFHVCITSYQLVVQDHQIFRRKRWRYMILDEAHNIKNFKSNRWNALLNFNTENRLLLTGTPLQNNIMELWSLLYFLMPSSKVNQAMPSGFANLDDFQTWFGKPVDKIIEGGDNSEVDEETKKTVHKLHQVLRPYLLRRLKADVEAQMPAKHEHVVYCRLSKRQYKLYHEYLARSDTRETLKNANYISIINALMQLRKVCNHPDLFEERPITTSFAISQAIPTNYEVTNSIVEKLFHLKDNDEKIDLKVVNLIFTTFEYEFTRHQGSSIQKASIQESLIKQIKSLEDSLSSDIVESNYSDIKEFYKYSKRLNKLEFLEKLKHTLYLNELRTDRVPIHGYSFLRMLNIFEPVQTESIHQEEYIKPLETRILSMKEEIDRFAFVTPAVVTMNMKHLSVTKELEQELISNDNKISNPFHKLQTKLSIQFPDKNLLLYDCGKLQKLAKLLQQLKDGGHRALIFTQMTKVLDVLEQFLNIMGIRYMRLDGATKIEDRQILTERFNSDPKITVFILSTRSGGLGINLTGADTVIFYDSDWNPAMDKQCQDRCHRIGQTRDVHIYRFVSEYTIESNILKKANQKRHLDNVVIQEGEFNTDYFGKLSVKDLVGEEIGDGDNLLDEKPLFGDSTKIGNVLAQAEDDADAAAAKEAMKEADLDNEEFDEDKSTQANSKNGTPGVTNDNKVGIAGDEFDDDDNYGHIDEYMIRFIANGHYYD
ncbi:putative helicase [Wickerhamomyces ciferrii]|uniref:Helicase SWR1 n=1 Tax=Wickerhamomyces ciferrii (strain ATCC 14091 / BCRC 22168 / CBS 111 / JCM 3599 / NBRC 0793 / NRRL Y-1031 F-60-10) TaxID=1206466 RepID=K0KKR8_WICCF|nr:putative helicase [Wickerhamomyces ciferrii]CCH45775.1 putative helicase [Wickerhamomyces ciferrii]